MRWWNRYNFPYSNFHDLNLDWIIKEMNRLIEEWEQLKAEWDQMKIEWAEFKAEMQRLWQEYQDLMNAAWEAFQEAMRDEWDEYRDDLTAQWTTYQNNLNAAWLAYQNAMNTWKDGVDQDIQDKFDEIDAALAQLQQQVRDFLDNLPYESIINTAVNNWLIENGVEVGVVTPEMYGAVGDGETDDTTAFNRALFEVQNSKKELHLKSNATYKITSIGYSTRNIVLHGNNATINIPYQNLPPNFQVNHAILKDVTITAQLYAQGEDISNLVLDNVKCIGIQLTDSLQTGVNSSNVIIRNVVSSANTLIGSPSLVLDNLTIDGLLVTSGATSIHANTANISNVKTPTGTVTIYANNAQSEINVNANININNQMQYSNVIFKTSYTAV